MKHPPIFWRSLYVWLLIGLLLLSCLHWNFFTQPGALYAVQPCFTPASAVGAAQQTIPTSTATPTATATPSPSPSPTDGIKPCPPMITPTATHCIQSSVLSAPELTPTASATPTPAEPGPTEPPSTATSTSTPTSLSTPPGGPTATEPATVTATSDPCLPPVTPVSPCMVGAVYWAPSETATPTITPEPTPTMAEPTPTVTSSPTTSATATPCPTSGPTPTVQPPSSLTIHKSGPELAQVGEPFVYELVVENRGSTVANQLRVFDHLPARANYVASPGGTVSVENDITRVEWTVDTLAAGSSVTLSLTVSAPASVVNAQYGVRVSDDLVVSGQAPVLTLISGDISTEQISPETGGVLTSNAGNLQVTVPPGAITAPVTFAMVVAEAPFNQAGFAGLPFVIQARTADGTPVTNFAAPLRLVMNYADSDWQAAGLLAETELNLFYWEEPNWIAILPCTGCRHDTESNTFEVMLDHLTLFALRAGLPEQNHLPLIQR